MDASPLESSSTAGDAAIYYKEMEDPAMNFHEEEEPRPSSGTSTSGAEQVPPLLPIKLPTPESPAPELLVSAKGGEKLAHGGYLYNLHRITKDGSRKLWKCERIKDCKARLHQSTEDGVIIKEVNLHSHDSDAALVEVRKITSEIKRKAETSFDLNFADIKRLATANTPEEVRKRLPTDDAMRRMIMRKRKEFYVEPDAPANRESIVFPEPYTKYPMADGVVENFLLIDSGLQQPDPKRILIFGREQHIQWSSRMQEVFLDGTFSIPPPNFEAGQLLVLMAREDSGYVLPVLYALLPDKTKDTYKRLFEMIKALWPQFNPTSIFADFEQPLHEAIKEGPFSNAHLFGCFFHMMQALRRELTARGLQALYGTDVNFQLHAQMVISMAFVPPEFIDIAISSVEDHLPESIEPVLDWFTAKFIGRLRVNQTRAPCPFPNSVWNAYLQTIVRQDKAIYFAEIAHRRLQKAFSSDHASIWKYVQTLKRTQRDEDAAYAKFLRGEEKTGKHRGNADKRILELMGQFARREIATIDFLKNIALTQQTAQQKTK